VGRQSKAGTGILTGTLLETCLCRTIVFQSPKLQQRSPHGQGAISADGNPFSAVNFHESMRALNQKVSDLIGFKKLGAVRLLEGIGRQQVFSCS
jgi:hypothetical protein